MLRIHQFLMTWVRHCENIVVMVNMYVNVIKQSLTIISAFGPAALQFSLLVWSSWSDCCHLWTGQSQLLHCALDEFSALILCSATVLQRDECSIGHIRPQPTLMPRALCFFYLHSIPLSLLPACLGSSGHTVSLSNLGFLSSLWMFRLSPFKACWAERFKASAAFISVLCPWSHCGFSQQLLQAVNAIQCVY